MAMSKDEILAAVKAVFDMVDTNGDGALAKEEIKAVSMKLRDKMQEGKENPEPFNEERFNTNFERMDKNGDGKVTCDELSKIALIMAEKAGMLKAE